MKTRSIAFILLMSLLLFACKKGDNGKAEYVQRERLEGEAEINPMVEDLDNTENFTIRVTLQKVVNDSLIFREVGSDEYRIFEFVEADQAEQIKGSITVGDEYAVLPDLKKNSVKMAINLCELSGKWFYDMEQHRGLEFELNGAISSINTEDISFREWKLLNDQFYIYYLTLDMVSPDRHEYLVEPAGILSLDKDHLTFRFLGNTYDCQRQKEVIKMKF